MKKIKANDKGITLVALVVTIVMLLILSTISIQAVFSENGILRSIRKSKKTQESIVQGEELRTDDLSEKHSELLKYYEEKNLIKGPNGKRLVTTITTTNHENIVGEDKLGNQVVVPNGFKIAEDSGSTVKEGIVIEDSDRNQFVWIPVSNINGDGTNKIKINSANEEGVEITLGRYSFATTTPRNPYISTKCNGISNTSRYTRKWRLSSRAKYI